MTNLTCIIIDDEAAGRIVIRELLWRFHPDVNVLGEASNMDEAFREIRAKKPDFVFLDIQMPGGSGFDLLKRFASVDFEIIFVTSFEKYAINAIRTSALDYLLKPVDINDLKNSIEKVKKAREQKINNQPLIVNLLNNMDSTDTEKKMVVHHLDKVKLLKLSDVVCLEAESNYSHIYTTEGQRFTPARVLKEFEEFLSDQSCFLRINKSVIVNLDYVTEYSKGEPCILHLSNGKEYEIGRRKKAEMMERIKR
jgi:two-component system, LytTR family, response regulator